MFLPLKDINPTARRPIATYSLIIANVVVFLYELSRGSHVNAFIASFGATPYEITRLTDLVGQHIGRDLALAGHRRNRLPQTVARPHK